MTDFGALDMTLLPGLWETPAMWLYQHHTCSDLIDLNPYTGRWRHVRDEEKPNGARALADLPVEGSYLQENDKRYYSYWTDDGRFVFST